MYRSDCKLCIKLYLPRLGRPFEFESKKSSNTVIEPDERRRYAVRLLYKVKHIKLRMTVVLAVDMDLRLQI